jgi:hypothetical protein
VKYIPVLSRDETMDYIYICKILNWQYNNCCKYITTSMYYIKLCITCLWNYTSVAALCCIRNVKRYFSPQPWTNIIQRFAAQTIIVLLLLLLRFTVLILFGAKTSRLYSQNGWKRRNKWCNRKFWPTHHPWRD